MDFELRQEQRQEREPERITPELYNDVLATVARDHLQKITLELHQLQSDILQRVKLTKYGKDELNNFVLSTPTELLEKIKDILWT